MASSRGHSTLDTPEGSTVLDDEVDNQSSELSDPEEEDEANEDEEDEDEEEDNAHEIPEQDDDMATPTASQIQGNNVVDSEAETEPLEPTPRRKRRPMQALLHDYEKMKRAGTAQEDLSEPPSPVGTATEESSSRNKPYGKLRRLLYLSCSWLIRKPHRQETQTVQFRRELAVERCF